MPGPVPKRSDQRRRRNRPSGPDLVRGAAGPAPDIPPVQDHWHPIAQEWYRSLSESGQSQYYEASDWATAVFVAEAMSRNLLQGRFSAQLFASVMSAMSDLLTTEGARRRARIELERVSDTTPAADPTVAIMERYRKAAGSS